MNPDEVYESNRTLEPTSNFFRAGHRTCVETSSNNFQRFDRNLNTDGNNYDETKMVVAHNTTQKSTHHISSLPGIS